jgi:glycosyltransferase involved in cell wall biosynthesis
MRIFLPISLDQWKSPIASLLRAIVKANPQHQYFSFSNPKSEEDIIQGEIFWNLPNINKITIFESIFTVFDIVQTATQNPRNVAISLFIKLKSFGKCLFLTTVNLEIDSTLPKRDYWSYKLAMYLADGVVAVSESAAQNPRLCVGDRFIGVISNGYDPDFFNPLKDYSRDLPDHLVTGDYALFISALEPRKNPEFIWALANRMKDVKFIAAGWQHPLYGDRYKNMLTSLPNVIWLGHLEQRQIRALMQQSFVLLFPSEREGLPLTVIEALAMNLPVIAQAKSSLPELIVDGQNGKLIDISDVEFWKSAILDYKMKHIANKSSKIRYQINSMKSIYSWDTVGLKYRDVYSHLVKSYLR